MKTTRVSTVKRHLRTLTATLLTVLFAGHPVLADDTEVLIGPGGQARATPNVLFIMDTSGSMAAVDRSRANRNRSSRLEIVQGVFADLMGNSFYHGINVALMRFDRSANGGYFVTPMQELNDSTSGDIITASNAFTAGGNTPLSETLYEAARFWGGLSVDYGDSSNPAHNVTTVLDPNNTANYISPISSQCQKNYTILLTDGEPTDDDNADNSPRIPDLPGYNSGSCNFNANPSNDCLDEVAHYLHTIDQNSSIPGIQTVETYTIGFTTAQDLLEDTARRGGGEYITANNANSLKAAFEEFLGAITDTNNSFSPPALAANTFNGVSHHDKLYFTLFEPTAAPKWNGNVKPYVLNDNYDLVDANGNDVIDEDGFFNSGSRSFWSDDADGGSIVAGGANGRLPVAASRKLYTYTDGYDETSGRIPDEPALTDAANLLDDANDALTRTLLGLSADLSEEDAATQRTTIINATRTSTLDAPLHSQPVLVTYGGSDSEPDITLFVATNGGFLHAIDARTHDAGTTNGQEQFAFMPKELLKNLPVLTSTTGIHPYGLDGAITAWVKESDDDDHTIKRADGDHVYVYVGMRRGGNNYYALDVTERDAPKLKWVIRGGENGSSGFSELGQSWSRPTLTTIKYGAGIRTVLIFGGGYDTDQDDNPVDEDGNIIYGATDNIGRAIFIVDANTGEKLWQAGPADSDDGSDPNMVMADMTNSIPSDVRLLDSDFDGHTDRLYVGDMRGQVFRIDLQATSSGISGSGVLLADLGGSTATNNRRFYYPPDVVVTQRPGAATYVSVNIGSGYRAHPLNPLNTDGTAAPRVNDRFYSLHDALGAILDDFTTITNGSLFDATTSLVTSDIDIDDLADANGWYITLGSNNGEKVLAPAMTLNGEIFFTTYTPPESTARSSCAPQPGTGRLYRVSLFNATPVSYADEASDSDGGPPTPTTDDRITVLDRPGIPSAPTAMFRENSDGNVEIIHCEGTECERLPDAIQMQETYWRDDG
jgi:type IV pilus assembly protein PilY1